MKRPDAIKGPVDSPTDLHEGRGTENDIDKPSHYGVIAKRLTGWTSNLLATALVLVIAIVGGRELVSWWSSDAAESVDATNVSPAANWTAPRDSYLLEFGDSPFQFQRDRVVGNREKALAQIQTRCREALSERPTPHPSPGVAERKLLKSIADLEPVAQLAGKWRIFDSPGPMPMLVGIRDDCTVSSEDSTDHEFSSRMVVWGMAIPESEDVWNTYTCRTSQSNHDANFESHRIELPVGSRKTLAISGHDGSKIIGFSIDDESPALLETATFFERTLSDKGWEPLGNWNSTATNWRAEFTRQSPSPIRMEIQLHAGEIPTESGDSMRGLITLTPDKDIR